ncbi:hypothetical protein GOQ04_25220, partial [Emticicia sp. ODNR4P]|nr:hypothetical protein [Emticicia sp. ODNR4P]
CPLITSASSNGTAVISAYTNCSLATAGTLTQGTAVSGVTQSLQVTVTTAGTYNISASANGVTFAGTGTVATGTQTIVLTATGTPLVATSGSYTLNTTPNCSFSRSAVAALSPLPSGITMTPPADYTVASVNDNNYLPYTAPTGPATTSTGVNPDATAEATTVNVQGTITTTGSTILIPYTVTGSSVSLPAFSSTITIPAEYTQDGISRDLTLSYAATTLAVGSGTISATIKAVGGTLNLKQLDINAGIGSDSKGVLAGQFTLSTNSSGATTNLGVRIIAGIPDRMFGVADNTGNTNTHKFLYIPVTAEDGKVWLNNNLGADYANVNSTSFNPAQQATSVTDYKAYGSLFQWGRKPDGHELITWTSGTVGAPVNGTTATVNISPTNALFILGLSTASWNWNLGQSSQLWDFANPNNPCPVGFRVPTGPEYTTLASAAGITDYLSGASSKLKFTASGVRRYDDGTLATTGNAGYLWTTTPNTSNQTQYFALSSVTNNANGLYYHYRAQGYGVRCIQN